jgi:hypothetical protein
VSGVLPLLLTFTYCDVFCPATTLPKFRLVGETSKLPIEPSDFPFRKPAQPFRRLNPKNASTKMFAGELVDTLQLFLGFRLTVTARPLLIKYPPLLPSFEA